MQKAGQNITFKYNAQGIRTEKTVNGITTQYHLVGDQVTYETDGTDTIYYTYDSAGNLVSMNLNGIEYYYVYNAQGDIIALIDAAGSEVASYTYDTWGKLLSIEGTLKDTVGIKNPYRYRSYRFDTETGLYYLQSRYYNPEFGRFINADALEVIELLKGELLGINLFAYCMNNPVNMDDTSGYLPRWAKIAIGIAAIGIGITAAVLSAGTAAALIPALVTALQITGAGVVSGALWGAAESGISTWAKGESTHAIGSNMLKGAVDGAVDGFMYGGAGVLASKAGSGWKIGKNLQVLYKTPSTKGGALFALKKPKVRIELDMLHGLHGHWGKGKAVQKIHRSLNPFRVGIGKKGFWW